MDQVSFPLSPLGAINQWLLPLLAMVAFIIIASFIKALHPKVKRKAKAKNKGKNKDKVYLYQKKASLLTGNELKFYRELLPAAAAKGLVVFAKVRIADLLEPQKSATFGALAKIDRKHVDFVLCDKASLKPILVVELDDSSHDRPDRQDRDEFVDQAMKSAKMPILHTRDSKDIIKKLNQALTA